MTRNVPSTNDGAPPYRLRTLRVRKLREIFAAPELARYLGQRGVDFQLVDQVEALRVRVERGLELVADRAQAAMAAARRRAWFAVALLCVLAGGVAGAFFLDFTFRIFAFLAAAPLIAGTLQRLLWLRRDYRSLEAIRTRYDDAIREVRDIARLKALARTIWFEVESLGGGSDGGENDSEEPRVR